MKIGQKLTLAFLGVALLIGVAGYISLDTGREALQESIGESSISLAAGTLSNIDRAIYNKIEEFQIYAGNSEVQKVAKESNEEFEKLDDIQHFIEQKDKEWTSVPEKTVTDFMWELANNEPAEELKRRLKFYEEKYGYKVFGEVFITNKYGANVAQTGKTSDYNQADEEWWQIAKKDGLYVADVRYDVSSDVYSTDIGVRIDDEAGNFAGVIKAALNVESVIDVMKKAKETSPYETTELKLFDAKGGLIFSTEGDIESFEDILDGKTCGHITGNVGHILKAGEQGEGEELFAYAYSKGYRDYKPLGWILAIEYETKEIFVPVAELKNIMLIVSITITMIAVLIGLFVSRTISKPIKKLKNAAIEVSKGKFDATIEIKSEDEIGELANSFNRMTWHLKKMVDNLNGEVAERRKVEASLRKSEERFEEVAESSGDWIWEINAEGLYTYSSPVVEKLLGYKPEEVVGKKYFYDFFAPDVKEELKKAAFEVFAKHESFKDFSNFNIHKNGSTVILETSGTPIVDDEGNLCGYRGADRDVTERKGVEEKNMQTLSLLTATLESTADGILVVDPNGRVISYNQKFQQLWRIPDELIESRDDDKLLAFVLDQLMDPEEFLAGVRRLYAGVEKESFDLLRFKDGRVFERFSQPQKIENRVVGRVWSFRNVTEREQAEEAIRNLNRDLESTIQKLSWSNRQLQEFTYIAAHDLKAPLRAIGTLADWLSTDYSDKFDEQGKEKVRLLVGRAKRIDKLIDSILQYSEIGDIGQKTQKVDLNLLLSKIIHEIRPPDNIEIIVENKLPVLICNKKRIAQIFHNLLSNAVKYMDKPKGQIRIGCREDDGFWTFSVSDNGPGIEQRYFEKIFKIFQTLSTRDEVEAVGIGLSLTKKIVELYGGRIWVQSEPGQGSTFCFTLPKKEMRVKDALCETNLTC